MSMSAECYAFSSRPLARYCMLSLSQKMFSLRLRRSSVVFLDNPILIKAITGRFNLQLFRRRCLQDSLRLKNFSRLMNLSWSSDRSLPDRFSVTIAVLFFSLESSFRQPVDPNSLWLRSSERNKCFPFVL